MKRLASVVLVLLLAAVLGPPPPVAAADAPRLSLPEPVFEYPRLPWRGETIAPRGGGPSFEDQVMEIVNQERWDNGGLPPLKRVSLLDNSSETHSSNMATRNFFAHCDLDTGDGLGDRLSAAGYAYFHGGENIAGGSSTPQGVMDLWMASSGHKANILQPLYTELGIGYAMQSGDAANVRRDQVPINGDCVADSFGHGPFVHYWTQNFGSRLNVYPVVIEREAYETSTRNVDLYLYGDTFAEDMRLRNENGAWTGWLPFATNVAWQLSAGSGVKTVNVEIRNGGSVRSASDTIVLSGSGDVVFNDGFESGNTSSWSLSEP